MVRHHKKYFGVNSSISSQSERKYDRRIHENVSVLNEWVLDIVILVAFRISTRVIHEY